MSPDLLAALVVGFIAGAASGLFGIGGGILFVPALVVFLDQSQLSAQATSLVSVIIVASVGALRQHRYGNVRLRDALIVGVLSAPGVVLGAILANNVPERVLELLFASVQLYFAYELVRRAVTPRSGEAVLE